MFLLDCNEMVRFCYDARKMISIVKLVIKVLQFSVPALLIFLGTWDMFKAVTKGDQKVSQDVLKAFIRRLVSGLIVFLVPFLVRLILGLVENNMLANAGGDVSATSWVGCWNNADKSNSDYFNGCENTSSSKSKNSTQSNTSTSTKNVQIDCSEYTCPTNASFLGTSKSLNLVGYKDACYCKASIPQPDVDNSYSCSNIKNAGAFAFSERDNNTVTDLCYFYASKKGSSTNNGSGNSQNGNTNSSCNKCNKGKYDSKSNKCIWELVKYEDLLQEQNNCKYTCGSKANEYNEFEKNGSTVCQCIGEPHC